MSNNTDDIDAKVKEITERNDEMIKMLKSEANAAKAVMEKNRKYLESIGTSPEELKGKPDVSVDELPDQAKALHDNILSEFIANVSADPHFEIADSSKPKPKPPRRKRGLQI